MTLNKKTQQYFVNLQKEVKKVYDVAEVAKSKGLDPIEKVEIPLATNMAEKVEGLISTMYPQLKNSGVVKRILELEKEYGKLDPTVVFKIAEDVAKQKFCQFSSLIEAIDAGIRVAFAYQTIAVVASPLEGYTGLKLGKTKQGKEYFIAYFSGPIRSAGTTASCVVLMIIDYLRELFGYAKYDPDENEVKRYVTENLDYHERVTNLQYLPLEEEMEFLAKNLPIQIAGEPTEKREVSNYKNLERVDTNNIRGGMCLIFSEGLAQKAAKGFRLLKKAKSNGVKSTGWDFLSEYLELHEKLTKVDNKESDGKKEVPTYIKDLVAGRPVYGHPSRSGSFRFRYGRARNSGFSASSVHPATMVVTDDFLATGTQLKIEKPTKGTAVTSCDSIDGPIVKLIDGSVKKLQDYSEARKISKEIKEIIYIGDFLMPFSDVVNRNAILLKPGYVEEWWNLELKKEFPEFNKNPYEIDFDEAINLSQKYKVPLHPSFIFYWTQISKEQFSNLIDWLLQGKYEDKIILAYTKDYKEQFEKGKRALELLGVEHKVTIENVVISEEISKRFFLNLGIKIKDINNKEGVLISDIFNKSNLDLNKESVLEIINEVSEFLIKDKAGDFIGARMGRPEKAKLRKLQGSPNILFPVGNEGGRLRSVLDAVNIGYVKSSWPIFYCENCGTESIYPRCGKCNAKCKNQYYFYESKKKLFSETAEEGKKGKPYAFNSFNIKEEFEKALKNLNMKKGEVPELIKGVRGMSSGSKIPEKIEKGILRAKYNLQVNKDGTIRFDGTELPVTHFKPKEIFTEITKLKELGYTKDIFGKPLENEEQILELMPHDVLLPSPLETSDEKADDVFFNISKFVDEELKSFYKLKGFHNLKNKKDLAGQLGVFMAPHNCAGVICRFIGLSRNQAINASPYMHAAVRRDCVFPTTNFVYSEKGVVKSKSIGSYVENLIKKGSKKEIIDDYGTEKIEIDKDIYSFGVDVKTKKLKKKKIKYFIRGKPPEKWVKVKTASGREQIMTPRHKFIYLDEKNNFHTKIANEIKKGDRIGVLNKFNTGSSIKSIFLPRVFCLNMPEKELSQIRIVNAGDFFRKLFKENKKAREFLELKGRFKSISDWHKLIPLSDIKRLVEKKFLKWEDIPSRTKLRSIFNNKQWDLNLKLSSELMWVLGFYSAEGYSRQSKTVSQIVFRSGNKEQVRKLERAIYKAFGLNPSFGEKRTKITICNKLVYYLFKYVLDIGEGAYDKKVPSLLFNVPKELLREYLSAYFDGDGTIVNQKHKKFICFYSVSRNLLDGVSLLISKFGLSGNFYKTKERLPGKSVLDRYKFLNKIPRKHILNHLTYSGKDLYQLCQILEPVNKLKKKRVGEVEEIKRKRRIKFNNKYLELEKEGDILVDYISEIEYIKKKEYSYCFEVEWNSEEDKNVLWGEQIINARCDGDEAAVMLLSDVLLNFSKEFLPSHRGGTQDAPLVLNSKIDAGEVDDQILDLEITPEGNYPLELYELAEQGKHSSEVKGIVDISKLLKQDKDPFVNLGFTHNTQDINASVNCSSYKTLGTMAEKVGHQMALVEKLRGVDVSDTARLIIERHFIRDMKGNLRSFSQQNFRCVKCNEILRRPPLKGVCPKCGGKIIFTIHEGGIKKYLEPALDLAEKYHLSPYLVQSLELVKRFIEGIFGKELEQQKNLDSWFKEKS